MKITRFEDIESWQLGRKLTKLVYGAVKGKRFSKDYGLKDQVCRASVSIMANTRPVKQLEAPMYYTYVLQSMKDKKFYTGFTKNLKLRFDQHRKGSVQSTEDRRP